MALRCSISLMRRVSVMSQHRAAGRHSDRRAGTVQPPLHHIVSNHAALIRASEGWSCLTVFQIDHLNLLPSLDLQPHLSPSSAEPPCTKRTKWTSSHMRWCIKRRHCQWFIRLLFLFCRRDFLFVSAQRSSRHEYKWVNQFQTPQFARRTAPALLAWKRRVQIRLTEHADRRATRSVTVELLLRPQRHFKPPQDGVVFKGPVFNS